VSSLPTFPANTTYGTPTISGAASTGRSTDTSRATSGQPLQRDGSRGQPRSGPFSRNRRDFSQLVSGNVRPCQRLTRLRAAFDPSTVSGRLLITKSEAAEQLGVSVRTIERLISAGRLPLVHVEGAARVRVADLGAYVQSLDADSRTTQSSDEDK
jgi:excisionase family DNA binding protein